MSDVVFGRDMILEINVGGEYKAFGCASSCTFSFENEIIGKTDANAGLFRKRRVRMSDCSGTVQGLTTLENGTNASVMYILQEGVRRTERDFRFRFTDEVGIAKQIQGNFLIEAVELTGEVEGFSEFDISIVCSGGFTISMVVDESGDGALAGNIFWDWWDTVEGEHTISGPGHYGRSFAGMDVIEVDKEGTQYDINSDFDHGRTVTYNGTEIDFGVDQPFNEGVRVFVIWQPEES